MPAELVAQIDEVHSSAEVDHLLVQLATHFPNSAELAEGVARAARRDRRDPERVPARVREWRGGVSP